jgi:hypothetical protein
MAESDKEKANRCARRREMMGYKEEERVGPETDDEYGDDGEDDDGVDEDERGQRAG